MAEFYRDFVDQYFGYLHLPEELQNVSRPFALMAEEMLKNLPERKSDDSLNQLSDDMLDNAFHRLLEAKDCFVRAHLPEPKNGNGS